MDGTKLVHMANQIAAFFAAEPDRNVAIEGVATHLKRFWEPRMRREILAMVDSGQVKGMHELVLAALQGHRQNLQPAP
jgi:formate dehydrogenase subunit delta